MYLIRAFKFLISWFSLLIIAFEFSYSLSDGILFGGLLKNLTNDCESGSRILHRGREHAVHDRAIFCKEPHKIEETSVPRRASIDPPLDCGEYYTYIRKKCNWLKADTIFIYLQ